MTTSTSVHSNALNFMSCLQSGVDPRTGLYNVSISLPDIPGNDLRGPGSSLGLAYSPLNTQDSGYGMGWSLQLSQFDPGRQILSLSTGETFKVTDSSGDRLLMTEQKLKSFHFYRQDATHFRVVHKSGLVEILEVMGSEGNRVALPVRIYAPSGHGISLEYQAFSSTQLILRGIQDDLGQALLSIRRDTSSIELLMHPFAAPDGGPLARFVMNLSGSSRSVTSILLPTENQASWRFFYGFEQGDQLCIKEVHTPTGAREEVYYQDSGHAFPVGSGRLPLPRVTRHLVYPGADQPQIDVRYTYRDTAQRTHNFLGAGLNINWVDDGLDNLYKHRGEYDYVCTESLWVDDEAVRSIERTFNRFHLQTREATTQNNHVQVVDTHYYIDEGKPYEQQSNYCQMPREIRTSWRLLDNPTRTRSETVSNTYDSHGNLLTHTRADGIVETSTWYPAAGADGCPADPEGFVRQLKDKTVTPAPSAQVGAPTLCTRYRYSALPPLDGSPLPDLIVPSEVTLVQLDPAGERELQHTRIDYLNLPDQAFLHGRGERQVQTLDGKSTITAYVYSKLNSPQLGVPVQQISTTLSTDFDSVTATTLSQYSLLSGQELLTLVQGVETRYEYDALGRLVRETVAPDTEFEASRQYRYALCANVGEQAEQVMINARQVTTRTRLDGLGRPVLEERDHVDDSTPERIRQTWAARYDAWNNLEEETSFDWLEGRELALARHYAYDDWGQQCRVTEASGVSSYQDLDPIGSSESGGPIQRSWLQSAGLTPLISGRTETWLNLFGKAERTMSLDAAQQVLGTRTYRYDGLGRCTEQSDESRNVTQFSYDPWSRLISSTLPDNSIVSREYAAHSSAELPIALNVQYPDGSTRVLAGEQEFDGLQRLTRVKVGPRSEDYRYDADRAQIKSRTTAAGDTIDFDYNLLLTDQPVASHAPDESAEYAYDRTSARLTRARNEQGLRSYDYDPLNRMRSESWQDNQGKTWQTLYVNSAQGRALKRTELKQDNSPGLDTLYHYDTLGRLDSLEQGQLQMTLAYDPLGQVSSITSRDRAANTTLVTGLEYDDQGREIRRTLTLGAHPVRTLEQIWQSDGLLESRHLQQGGSSLLKENFYYDTRGRLTRHSCSGSTLPRDALGREISQQIFTFDALDNLTLSMTTFVGGTTERARFNYAADDPCQLQGVTYTPPRATPDPGFSYDLNGNQLNDERGQLLHYDSQSRLLGVESPDGQAVSQYRYDSHDHLVTSRQGSGSEVLRFYQGQQLSNSVQDGRATCYLYLGDQALGQQQADDPARTLLLLTDANGSVLGESQQGDLRTAVYSAYGERHSEEELLSQLGFNGEIRDPDSGWYLLGQGYRAYNPGLMRFHSPDAFSPFGAGGLNPYGYCLGNPVALRDPSGHAAIGFSGRLRSPVEDQLPEQYGGGANIMAWVGVAVGVVFAAAGIYSLAATFGLAAPISLPLLGFGVATTATGTAVLAATTGLAVVSTAAGVVAATDPENQTAERVAFWTGMAGIGVAIAPSATKGAFKAGAALFASKQSNGLVGRALVAATFAKNPALLATSSLAAPSPSLAVGTGTILASTSARLANVSTQTDAIPMASQASTTAASVARAGGTAKVDLSGLSNARAKLVKPTVIGQAAPGAPSQDELAAVLKYRNGGLELKKAVKTAHDSGAKHSEALVGSTNNAIAYMQNMRANPRIRQ